MSADELRKLVDSLFKPSALIELAIVAGCLLLAWGLVRVLRGKQPRPGSTWFGDRIVDGALFPALALLFVWLARALVLALWPQELPQAVMRLAVPVLMSLAVIRLTVRILRVSFPDSQLMRVVERSVSWLAWIAVVLWITGAMPLILAQLDAISWKVGASKISLRNIIEGSISAVLVLMLALWLSSLLEARLLRGATDNLSFRKIAANALRALLLLVGLVFALSAAGIDLTALGVLGGALGVGIGLGLQKLAANYVSGFVILAERSIRIGDMVKVDNFEGRVSDITMRYTVILALNGREAIVPNEMMVTQRVENLSLSDTRVSISTTLRVAHGSDVETLMLQLLAAVADVPRVLKRPEPAVVLAAFAPDGLELNIGFWIDDPHNGQGNVLSDVNLAVLRVLQQAGVTMAYPQRMLHMAAPPEAAPATGAATAPAMGAASAAATAPTAATAPSAGF